MYSREFYNRNLRDVSRVLRNRPTNAESIIWKKHLRYLKPKVHRQRPMGKFIVDFYIPKAKLIIEIDGDSHFSEKAKAKDAERTKFFNNLDLKVIRFTNSEVFYSFEFVCKKIQNEITCSKTPPSPL
jgi:very-short-patch-repair endonuclease